MSAAATLPGHRRRLPPHRREVRLRRQGAFGWILLTCAILGALVAGSAWAPTFRMLAFGCGVSLAAGALGGLLIGAYERWLLARRLRSLNRTEQFWSVFSHLDEASQRQIKGVLDTATVRLET